MSNIMRDRRFSSVMGQLPGMGGRTPGPYLPSPSPQDPGAPQIGPQPPMNMGAPPPKDRASQFYDELKRIRGEQGEGITAYKQALNEMPQEADYKPNWMTRIGAGLAGASTGMRNPAAGVAVAQQLNRSGYMNAMDAYGNKLGGLREQANLEQKELDTKAEMVNEAMKYGLDYDKYLLSRDKQTSDISHQRAQEQNWRVTGEAATTRANAAAREEYDYTPVQGGFMVTAKHDPSQRMMVQALTVQDAQNKVAQQNANAATTSAGAAATNAETGQYNAITNRGVGAARINNLQADTANTIAGTPIPAGAQNSARDLAAKELFMDEQWAQFDVPDAPTYMKIPQEERALFEEALNRKIAEIQNRRR